MGNSACPGRKKKCSGRGRRETGEEEMEAPLEVVEEEAELGPTQERKGRFELNER